MNSRFNLVVLSLSWSKDFPNEPLPLTLCLIDELYRINGVNTIFPRMTSLI